MHQTVHGGHTTAPQLLDQESPSPLANLVDDYLISCRGSGLSPRTDEQYGYALKPVFLSWAASEDITRFDQLDPTAGVTLADGELVTASVVIWTAGVTVDGTVAAGLTGRRGPGGRVVVEADLSLPGHPEVFVVGDAAAVPGPDGSALGGGHLEPGGSQRFLPSLPKSPSSQATTPPARSAPVSKAVRRHPSPTATRGSWRPSGAVRQSPSCQAALPSMGLSVRSVGSPGS